MAGARHIITQNQPDSHQATPWAGITILSFQKKDVLFDSTVNSANLMAVNNFTIVSDILRLEVTSNKNSYMMSAEATLMSGDLNYQAVISPGDHALIWMHNDIGQFDRVMNAAAHNNSANDINSGLKFVGRVNSVRTMYTTTANGIKTIRYLVTFKGFSEFGNMVYYNPFLNPNTPDNQGNSEMQKSVQILSQITKQWNDYIFSQEAGSLRVQNILDFFIDIFLGIGPSAEARTLQGANNSTTRSPNKSFMIPKEVLQILGLKPSNSRPANYSDLLHTVMGIQSYTGSSFQPNINTSLSRGVQKVTPDQLYGNMTSLPDSFNNVPLWSLLQQHSNAELNEIYTSMRLNSKNRIVPTFIARQIPFTSPSLPKRFKQLGLGNSSNKIKTTKFLELPRWVMDPSIVVGTFNIGTSDAARFNFFQIYGQFFGINAASPNFSILAQIAAGNFVYDDKDVMRNGSRNMIKQTSVDLATQLGQSTVADVKYWAALISDWYANEHLKLSGSITTMGISDPICVGDNLEVAGKLFHIEGVTHSYEVADGIPATKSFYSTMQLSRGILSNGEYDFHDWKRRENMTSPFAPGFSDEERYIGDTLIISKPAESPVKKPDSGSTN